MNALIATESDQQQPHDDDKDQTGVPVGWGLAAIGATTPGGRSSRDLPACRIGRHI
jgi:hypothetical protein